MNKQKINFWFTLIELVVAITILAILAAVWFMWYSSYLPNARDTNRISQLEELWKWIQTYYTKNSNLPVPDNQIEIKAWSSEMIAYQWLWWKNLLDTIWYNQSWLDPKDKVPFSYMISANRKKYQLMAMLETRDNLDTAFNFWSKANASWDYKNRFPKVFWDELWILTDTDNTPIQDIASVQSAWNVDIINTDNTYIAHISDILTVSGTWKVLAPIALSMMNWKDYKSCKALYRWEPLSHSKDDFYYIKPLWYSKFKVYCDMTTDWWGWTRYVQIKWNYTYKDARYCVDNLKRIDNDKLFCFYPRSLWKLKDYLYIDDTTWTKYELSWLDQPYNEITWSTGNQKYKSKYKHTLFDFITDKTNSNLWWTRFWIAYMHNHPESHWGREPGWMASNWDWYMNYDQTYWKSWPNKSDWSEDREANARKWEFYVR